MNPPWTVKYRPKKLAEVAGNKIAIQQITDWLDAWFKAIPKKRAVLLHGPPGTGKTVSVEALARERGLDLVEINASDERNRDALDRTVGAATRQSDLFGRARLVLIDEVDGINLREDRGAVDTIVKLIQETQVPVVLTANDPWDTKIGPIRNATVMIEYKRLGLRDTLPYLKRICQTEGVEVDEQALRLIVDRNRGDMRSILNDLQTLSPGARDSHMTRQLGSHSVTEEKQSLKLCAPSTRRRHACRHEEQQTCQAPTWTCSSNGSMRTHQDS